MINIHSRKKQYEKQIIKARCGIDDKSNCPRLPHDCVCSRIAEIKAYRHEIVPSGYDKLDIFDFNGLSNTKKRLLPSNIVINVKNKICQYCWNKSWNKITRDHKTKKEKKEFMRKNSVLPQRLFNSNNIVIYGEASKPVGRTIVASIIMSEIIKLRLKTEYRSHKYEWIDFSYLFQELKSGSSTADVDSLRGCDWLVIDNITISDSISYQQQHYYANVFNPFLLGRLYDRLVTVLVIKDNIDKKDNCEEAFGLAINSVLKDKNTTLIPLS
tara:strand:+ start:33909 stop:34718 length:810 start_codon:yes stop_codon:yes gene_type:complete